MARGQLHGDPHKALRGVLPAPPRRAERRRGGRNGNAAPVFDRGRRRFTDLTAGRNPPTHHETTYAWVRRWNARPGRGRTCSRTFLTNMETCRGLHRRATGPRGPLSGDPRSGVAGASACDARLGRDREPGQVPAGVRASKAASSAAIRTGPARSPAPFVPRRRTQSSSR